ncbi:MAG: patatin-like phospholipase family protein [Chloroflexota bacterium]
MKRGVVLGGGGMTGISWEIGFMKGLRDGGVDVNEADIIVGTSAGAMVGAQVRLGYDLERLYAAQFAPQGPPPEHLLHPDMQVMQRLMRLREADTEMTPEVCRDLGQQAKAARAASAETFVSEITAQIGAEWPAKALVATGVDVDDGAIRGFDAAAGIALGRAVAISMCVPGMVKPIAVGSRAYMDGGVAGSHLALAASCDLLLALVTFEEPRTAEAARGIAASGVRVLLQAPNAESAEAMGIEPGARFDPARRGPAAEAGQRQATAFLLELREAWLAGN